MIQSHEMPERMVEMNGVRKYRINVQEVSREDSVVYTYDEVEFDVNIPVEISDAKIEKLEAKLVADKAKADKEAKLNAIEVEVNGKVFDGDEKARLNILSALQAAAVTGIESTYWKLADNSVVEVTVDELKEALTKAIQAVGHVLVG